MSAFLNSKATPSGLSHSSLMKVPFELVKSMIYIVHRISQLVAVV
jgi:hypothetical protein